MAFHVVESAFNVVERAEMLHFLGAENVGTALFDVVVSAENVVERAEMVHFWR